MTQEQLFSKYAADYPLEVPQDAWDAQLDLLLLEKKQQMQYEMLTGTAIHLQPQAELAAQMDCLRAQAFVQAKEQLVLQAILREQSFTITPQELEEEAAAMAQRQHTTVESIRRFFGKDFSLLRRDLLQRKAIAWACVQMLP